MNITRKILAVIGLITVVPFLVTLYLFKNASVYTFFAKSLIVIITVFISAAGLHMVLILTRMLTKLCNSINIIAKGDIDHRAEVETSSGTADLAVSINQVSQRLRESADELEKRTILLDRFNREIKRMNSLKLTYAEIAHELRAPLINIKKISELLIEGNVGTFNAEQENFLRSINNNVERLVRLTNNLLDIAKMEVGLLLLNYELLCVKDVIYESINSVDNWRQSKNFRIEVRVSDKIPDFYADKDRIIQVFVNLLSNAIKFTPPNGNILIEAEIFHPPADLQLSKDGEVFIEFSVQDNGIGISESQKKIIFDRFRTASDPLSKTLPSTGLGLSIAKQIAELHGGRIWVESQPGKGSKFAFIIPQGLKRMLKDNTPQAQKPGKRILIMDDEDNLRDLLGRELNKKGFFVTTAKDGLEGLKKALEHDYDLVITDVRMPNMDGVDSIKILKRINPSLLFVIITGFPIEQDLAEILKSEVYPCIRKPFDLQDLLKTVEELPFASVNSH
jgi:signal transduction histidine kinase/CheY-like chemotaxis protein